jgi:hypothetical protein
MPSHAFAVRQPQDQDGLTGKLQEVHLLRFSRVIPQSPKSREATQPRGNQPRVERPVTPIRNISELSLDFASQLGQYIHIGYIKDGCS